MAVGCNNITFIHFFTSQDIYWHLNVSTQIFVEIDYSETAEEMGYSLTVTLKTG